MTTLPRLQDELGFNDGTYANGARNALALPAVDVPCAALGSRLAFRATSFLESLATRRVRIGNPRCRVASRPTSEPDGKEANGDAVCFWLWQTPTLPLTPVMGDCRKPCDCVAAPRRGRNGHIRAALMIWLTLRPIDSCGLVVLRGHASRLTRLQPDASPTCRAFSFRSADARRSLCGPCLFE
ncbi:hypothetical protein MTO96_048546 [Rhipicephalus appendiculatus]